MCQSRQMSGLANLAVWADLAYFPFYAFAVSNFAITASLMSRLLDSGEK
jgi:hypothetical protein